MRGGAGGHSVGDVLGTVIAGVDGREGGVAAARLAQRLHPERIVLACAFPIDARPVHLARSAYSERLADDAEAMLRGVAERLGLEAETHVVLDRSAARALHELAERERADAIVVGPCRHPHAAALVALGDVTTAAVADAPCAVFVARPAGDGECPFRRIAVAYDGHAESRAALALAAHLTERSDAALLLRTVIDPLPPLTVGVPAMPELGAWPPLPDPDVWDAIVDGRRRDAAAAIDAALAELAVPASGDVVYGDAGDELVRLSEEVDLIVCGSRGWGTARRVLLGSTSDRLVRGAGCPVAVVPRPATVPPATAAPVASAAEA